MSKFINKHLRKLEILHFLQDEQINRKDLSEMIFKLLTEEQKQKLDKQLNKFYQTHVYVLD